MRADILSRLQFAFTIGYHILWPTFTIGTSAFVAWLSILVWLTDKPVYRDLLRFWMRLFALGFGMGVITGIVLSYEIGTNWAGFSRAVSNVVGPLLMYEAATAFFLESGFIGIMLFGEGRVSRGLHVFACVMVSLGSLISATWIIAANSWMQTPSGAVADSHGIFHVVSWWHVIFNPSFPYRLLHMVCASFLTCSFVVAGVSAFHLLQRRHVDAARTAFSMALWAALALAPLQILLGDMQGLNTRQYQPTKLAAMEGLWTTEKDVPAAVFAWPDMKSEKNLYEISIPHLASVYLTHTWDGEVQGLKAVPPRDRPYVPIVFFAFRIMVGVGLILLGLAVTGAVLRWRGRLFETKWFQYLAVLATPLGFVSVLAGWTVTETGRQPFVVYGMLRTADAASPVAAGAITTTLVGFFVIYNILLLGFLYFAGRLVLKGPTWGPSYGGTFRPGLDRAAPTVVGAPAATPTNVGSLSPGE
ncbi:MAG: cytochrome ubiquinol oxidase subunit I [Methylovirgula sp.]|uniref:cytochrome ubiquinol oxidase subunit I n=1 Tax=Methylovirgula sp. TaxID=1978224 RepID=UPI0030766FC0